MTKRIFENCLIDSLQIPAHGGQVTHVFPIYFLSSGKFEILYHAEDVRTRKIYYDSEWAIFNATESP